MSKRVKKSVKKCKVTNFDPKMVQKHSQERNQSEDLKNIGWTTKDTFHPILNNRFCIFYLSKRINSGQEV